MYRFYLNGITNEYHMEELAREFLENSEFEMIPVQFKSGNKLALTDNSYLLNPELNLNPDGIKREVYRILSDETGIRPEWGTLTGVRPLKLAFIHHEDADDLDEVIRRMKETYLIHDSKLALLRRIMEYQLENISRPSGEDISLYIHIPFCPTRCSYCSFATNVAKESEVSVYLDFLLREVAYVGKQFRQNRQRIESVYIGGGTPSVLSAKQLHHLVQAVAESFQLDLNKIEFMVEAGRPDTITKEKLVQLHRDGVDRISINPQSMNEKTLQSIGRSHLPEDIRQAFADAADIGFSTINSDVIAGLPGETIQDFANTLQELSSLGANNITVHTLSVKKGSELKERDPKYYRRNTDTVRSMLDYSQNFLADQGFEPYYIYRQKHQMGSFENVGYCKPGAHSLYNVRIMEEKQTILGLGAGAIGKRFYPAEDRLERIPNVGNVGIYQERFEEMLLRKNKYWD